MRGVPVFVLGALSGAVLAGWVLGVRPPESPTEVMLLARPPAPQPTPIPQPVAPEPATQSVATPETVPQPPAALPMAPEPVATPAAPVASPAPEPRQSGLTIPVAGVAARQLSDSFNEIHSGERHQAIDIMAPKGTPVFAVEDGRIAKLFNSKPGGHTIYQFDPSEKFAYYYAHLDRYAPGLAERQPVKRGDVIGYVGSSGNASPQSPHLHFAIFVLGPEKRWWKGTAINPYPLLAAH